MSKSIKLLLAGAVAFISAGQATAATTWTVTGTPTAGVSIAGYANTGGTDNATNAANNGALQTIQTATKVSYSGGVGISNADKCSFGAYCDKNEGNDPEHAIDNQQRYDMALLTFTSKVKLQSLRIDWKGTDSDMTVLAYQGANPLALVGLTYNQLISNGWTAIGHYANVMTSTNTAINAIGASSSYWLIGAFNPLAFSPGANPSGVYYSDSHYDYVKLKSVMGMVVPEPSSIALIGAALIGVAAIRRRRHNQPAQ